MKTVFVALVLLGTAVVAAVQPSAPQSVLHINPPEIGLPTWTEPGVQKDTIVHLTNLTAADVTISAVTLIELPNVPAQPAGWLGVAQTVPLVVPAGNTVDVTVQMNKDGVVTYPAVVLSGKIILTYAPPITLEDTIPIRYMVSEPLPPDYWHDTLQTACLSLAVLTNGNFGNTGNNNQGGANMNFSSPMECDTGANSRGQADIYLYDGSPVILRKTATDIVASWAIFDDGFASEETFLPVVGIASYEYDRSNPKFDALHLGTFITVDSLVKVEKTWYSPKGMVDSCQFILQKMLICPYIIGSAVPGLAIGEAIDWDVPSDSGSNGGNFTKNIGGSNATKNLVWLRGYNSADGESDCADNSLRYAGMAMLKQHLKNCTSIPMHGAYTQRMDSFVYPTGNFVPSELWEHMRLTGFHNSPGANDQYGVLIYKSDSGGSGWTLPANDTLTVWSALATTYQGGLADVTAQIDKAYQFMKNHATELDDICLPCISCCVGTTGDVNIDGVVDLRDLAWLVSRLMIYPSPALPCAEEANVNGVGIIDIADVALLVAYLTNPHGSKPTLPNCPDC